MVKSAIKLYSGGIATADNVASAIVPVSAKIVSVSWSFYGTTTGTLGMAGLYQLSVQSTGQFLTNDCRNIIDEFAAFSDCLTSGAACGTNKYSSIAGWSIKAGDKVYLHFYASGQAPGSARVNCLVNLA